MVIKLFKVILVLIALETVLFVAMIFFVMTDEPSNSIGRILYLSLKYILGFPLVLINENYPFFLDARKIPNEMIPLVLLNNLLQAGMIILVKSFFKK